MGVRLEWPHLGRIKLVSVAFGPWAVLLLDAATSLQRGWVWGNLVNYSNRHLTTLSCLLFKYCYLLSSGWGLIMTGRTSVSSHLDPNTNTGTSLSLLCTMYSLESLLLV